MHSVANYQFPNKNLKAVKKIQNTTDQPSVYQRTLPSSLQATFDNAAYMDAYDVNDMTRLKPNALETMLANAVGINPKDVKYVSQGAYGMTFQTGPLQKDVALTRGENVIASTAHAPTGRVLLKVQYLTSPEDEQSAMYEDFIHNYVSESPRIDVLGVSGADISPIFYWGATMAIEHNDMDIRARVTCMQYIPSRTLFAFLNQPDHALNPHEWVHLYVQLERATATLWALGLSHADLHAQNVLVSNTPNKGPRLYIIDYGLVVKVPEKERTDLVNTLMQLAVQGADPYDVATAFNRHYARTARIVSGVRRHVTPLQRDLRMWFMNPDSNLLRRMYEYVLDIYQDRSNHSAHDTLEKLRRDIRSMRKLMYNIPVTKSTPSCTAYTRPQLEDLARKSGIKNIRSYNKDALCKLLGL